MKKILIPFLLIAPPLLVILLYLPVASLSLMGDDYQWLQLAHEASLHHRMLFADLDAFFRPTNTWTMIIEKLFWGEDSGGFHITNLLLHSAATFLLILVGRRLGLSLLSASFVGVLWGCSPFSSELAIRVSSRHEDLLLIGWLGMMLAWPEQNRRWTADRCIAAACSVLLALFSKETWIVTPGFALILDISFRKLRWRRSILNFAGWSLFSALYGLAHYFLFTTSRNYFSPSLSVLAKIPHQLAAFFSLEVLMNYPLTWKGILALAITILIAAFVIKKRNTAGIVGLGFLILPMLPTLFVPFLPTRYTALPYAGFLLLIAAAFESLILPIGANQRIVAGAVMMCLALAVLIAGMVTVRAELEDAARLSEAHVKLLAEASEVIKELPLDKPVLVIRAENENPLQEIAQNARGLIKFYYVRHADPYGLIDTAALFDWVLGRQDVLIRRYDDWEERFQGKPGAALMHRNGGFILVSNDIPDLSLAARQWREQGFTIRVIGADNITSSELP